MHSSRVKGFALVRNEKTEIELEIKEPDFAVFLLTFRLQQKENAGWKDTVRLVFPFFNY